jgi:hypothetical protein
MNEGGDDGFRCRLSRVRKENMHDLENERLHGTGVAQGAATRR